MRNVPHIRPFKMEDLDNIYSVSPQLEEGVPTLRAMLHSAFGNTHSFLVEDKVVAVVGASFLWDGVWQVWALVSTLIRNHGIFFTKHCKAILEESAKAFSVRRYNAIVDATNVEHIRWLRTLGFEYEYVMIKGSALGTDIFGYVKWM